MEVSKFIRSLLRYQVSRVVITQRNGLKELKRLRKKAARGGFYKQSVSSSCYMTCLVFPWVSGVHAHCAVNNRSVNCVYIVILCEFQATAGWFYVLLTYQSRYCQFEEMKLKNSSCM